jgi:tRNA1(Val) A37 N6-methylase TrmN6
LEVIGSCGVFLAAWLQPNRVYRVLDVCTGAGDLPRLMLDWARPRGITLKIDAIDAQPATLAIATKMSAAIRSEFPAG